MKNKKDFVYLALIALLLALCGQLYYSYRYKPARDREISVFYNHDELLNDRIISEIRDADKFVYFAVYTFTRQDLENALLAAKKRGLEVRGITDRQQYETLPSQKKLIDELRKAGIPVEVQNHSGIMHMKVVVTEKAYASGSYNWTAAATDINDEVLETGRDAQVRSQYQRVLTEVLDKYK